MRNKYSRVPEFNSFKTHKGNSHRIEYSSSYNPDGTIRLTESGRVDIQAEIQSHAAETDMALIVAKLQAGDTSVLTSKKAMYGDFTQFPKTYAEILSLYNNSQSAFEALPLEIKSKYDNDINKWFSLIGTEDWMKDMGLYQEYVDDVPAVVRPDSPSLEVD